MGICLTCIVKVGLVLLLECCPCRDAPFLVEFRHETLPPGDESGAADRLQQPRASEHKRWHPPAPGLAPGLARRMAVAMVGSRLT